MVCVAALEDETARDVQGNPCIHYPVFLGDRLGQRNHMPQGQSSTES